VEIPTQLKQRIITVGAWFAHVYSGVRFIPFDQQFYAWKHTLHVIVL